MNKINAHFSSKKFIGLALLAAMPFFTFAQKPNWQNLDLKADSTFGMSTEKAYQELLKGKKSKPVIVGVLDGGVDYNHEDLKRIIWINKKEKPDNGIDDDKNGYIDDVRGWNFIGSAKGSVDHEALELTRLLRRDQAKFANADASSVAAADLPAFQAYQKMKADYDDKLAEAKSGLENTIGFKSVVDAMLKKMGKENPSSTDIQNYQPENELEGRVRNILLDQLKDQRFEEFYKAQLVEGITYFQGRIDYNLNMTYDPRAEFVGDNYADSRERFYGNNDIKGPDAKHGTHVAGIIAADRTNNLGIKGVADNVLIMGVRAVPDGDERDKDVANAIRYAVDNGAKVLNMSFGKAYSWDKAVVDDAIKYAMSKDVLLVQAAGNENQNIDVDKNFPDRRYNDGGQAGAFIVVGASGWKDDESLKASFSNYGKTTVDVFAPGVKIYSTVPDSKYENLDGTSMASPAVAGLAALIRSYYPKFSAQQVKDIILKSVVKVNHNVNLKVGEETKSVPFSDLCVTGGIVNVYNALKLAAETK
ncbi:S8 family peptidase [Pedobacter nutrimenti]|jgi:subtilisin family serine protease|uniref:Subtilase family protein n=1 Tax=Pedobacter nutrimenti TaxID=1241337 RepID=A0A318U911_9SPHI|nr:S8 family peptidase [Pedobacter nutrimenti]PYF70035.1 subtilase family protein [Pedobacter nutrimenti]